jgi:hypothetical protein
MLNDYTIICRIYPHLSAFIRIQTNTDAYKHIQTKKSALNRFNADLLLSYRVDFKIR